MKKFALLLFIFVFSSVSAFPQIAEILKRMDAHQKALRSLRADITINKFSAQSGEKYTKEGSAKFMTGKNDYFLRIDSTKPTPESFLINKNQYLLYLTNPNPLYLPNLKTAYTGTVTDSQRNLLFIFSILSNYSKVKWKADYSNILYLGPEKVNDKIPAWHLQLTPKTAKSYKKIEFWVNGDGMPIQTKVIENNGDWTMVSLDNLKKNEVAKLSEFQITLPKDIKLIKTP